MTPKSLTIDMTGPLTGKSFTSVSNKKILIIGNGISGVTCARHIRKNDQNAEITLISGESEFFFSRTALMYIYMGHMKYEHTKPYEDGFWKKSRIQLKFAWVEKVDFERNKLIFHNGEQQSYDILVLATGSIPNKFDWPGQDLIGVQGLYSLQDLQLMEKNTQYIKRAVIVGGGLIGIEMAEMLASRKISVTLLVREKYYWDNVLPDEEAKLITRHIKEHKIDLRLETELEHIEGDDQGRVKAVVTRSGESIECEFVGLAVGVRPNIEFLRNSGLDLNLGVLVDKFFRTKIQNVYAIGDCAELTGEIVPGRKSIEQVWYTGRMHGETLARTLTISENSYSPGVWFNSAKFFDIEYQTYGYVPNNWDILHDSFYWEDLGGRCCIRFFFKKESEKFLGVNVLGWRLRHEFFDKAISESWDIEKVMLHFEFANFNSEFENEYQIKVIEEYNKQYGKSIKFSKPSFFKRLVESLK